MGPKHSGTDGTEQSSRLADWYFPLLLVIALLILLAFAQQISHHPPAGPVAPAASWTPSPLPTGKTVRLTIDFGNGATKDFAALPWRAEMTVADLLEGAREFRPGIEFTQIGSGETGFLQSLDGLANQGAGGRNWLYRVDDQHATVSFCMQKIEPGMHILWTFSDGQYNEAGDLK